MTSAQTGDLLVQALQESNGKEALNHSALLNSLPQVVFLVDRKGRWQYLNAAWERLTGSAPSDAVGQPFTDFLHEEDLEKSWQLFASLVAGEEESIRTEVRFIGPQQAPRWVDVTARANVDGDGIVVSVSGTMQEISSQGARLRAEMEEQLQELNNLQRLMSRDAWLNYQGASPESTSGYLYADDSVEPLDQADHEALSADNALSRDDALSRGNGDRDSGKPETHAVRLPIEVRGEAVGALGVQDDSDNPLSPDEFELLESISRQVAEALENARLLEQTQKRAVELETVSRVSAATSTILETDKLLRAVVELTKRSFDLYHAHVYLLDHDGQNLVLAAGAGEAGDKMVEQGWQIPLDHPRSVVARAARAEEGVIVNDVRAGEGFLANPLLPATRAEMALPMMAGNRLLGVLDVQADRTNYFSEEDVRIQSSLATQVAIALQNARLYQEQLETAEQLREFDRLKSEFLASMSHELRTPLNSIIGFADVLLEGIDGQLNARMEEDVRLIRSSGEHLRELIGDILDMSKIEAGMMDLRRERVEVRSLVDDLEAFARTQLMTYDKDLHVSIQIGPEVDEVRADKTRLKQVLYNLLSNAIKFTAEGHVALSIAMDDDNLLVKVEDTGIGIREEDVSIVFEQFRQVDGSLTRSAGGTGLGLPISKSLVELHGGEIWVESEAGEGTTFTFTIPADPESTTERQTGPLPSIP